jgi:hypothetical protein
LKGLIALQQRFDFDELMKHEVKTNIKVTRKKEYNLDKAAEAFYKLLRR